ncbi:MAG: globin-coupled sensor protein [Phenylobacterium sp.]|nr:globin-coupled sensor protein [Phenylobacterium sp.]
MPRTIEDRLRFMKLDGAASTHVRNLKPVVMKALPAALDGFYDQVRATPETRAHFSGDAHMTAAQDRQLGHWDMISSGQFDDTYAKAVTKVGEIHARIGLEPSWYIGGYALVLESVLTKVLEARWPKGGFGARGPDVKTVAAEVGALTKATFLDMDLAISVYLEALETKRVEAERERAESEAQQNQMVAALADGLRRVAGGDLTAKVEIAVEPRFQAIKDDFNTAISGLQVAMSAIATSTSAVHGGSDEISSAADDLSRRTEHQAASLEQTTAALDEITATVRQTAAGARAASEVVLAARGDAQTSGEVVQQAVAAMAQIEQSSSQISQIIGVIDEIAFQTNLLALNAGVEAARAGEAGRGFAVVASEVRALAQRSAEAAKEIKTLISASSQQVGSGVQLVGQTGDALQRIVDRVAEIDTMVSEIAATAQEQSVGLAQVNTAVNQMDQVTQQNAAMVEETTAAASSLKNEAGELTRLISGFHTGAARAGPTTGHRRRAA